MPALSFPLSSFADAASSPSNMPYIPHVPSAAFDSSKPATSSVLISEVLKYYDSVITGRGPSSSTAVSEAMTDTQTESGGGLNEEEDVLDHIMSSNSGYLAEIVIALCKVFDNPEAQDEVENSLKLKAQAITGHVPAVEMDDETNQRILSTFRAFALKEGKAVNDPNLRAELLGILLSGLREALRRGFKRDQMTDDPASGSGLVKRGGAWTDEKTGLSIMGGIFGLIALAGAASYISDCYDKWKLRRNERKAQRAGGSNGNDQELEEFEQANADATERERAHMQRLDEHEESARPHSVTIAGTHLTEDSRAESQV